MPLQDVVVEELESVQQSHFGSEFAYVRQLNWQIGALMRRAVIPHLKRILITSKLKIEMQIDMKWYIFLSVTQLWAMLPRRGRGYYRDSPHFTSVLQILPSRCFHTGLNDNKPTVDRAPPLMVALFS